MENNNLFTNERDRSDFFIALVVIAFFGFLIFGRGCLDDKDAEKLNTPVISAELDSDGDGVIDEVDKCKNTYGTGKYGCPEDYDRDGVYDHLDNCPEQKGLAENNGCPKAIASKTEQKNDFYKVAPITLPTIGKTKTVQEIEKPQVIQEEIKDSDNDGVADKDDDCPMVVGVASNNGCPEKIIIKLDKEDEEIISEAIRDVRFETGNNILKASSKPVLDKVVTLMNKYPDAKISISGHTDNTGEKAINQELSEARAASCKAYLQEKGINSDRISSAGYGESKPIATNDTPEGRKVNRRVEFELYK